MIKLIQCFIILTGLQPKLIKLNSLKFRFSCLYWFDSDMIIYFYTEKYIKLNMKYKSLYTESQISPTILITTEARGCQS